MSANRGLFDISHSTWLGDLLGVSEGDLRAAHRQSCVTDVVRKWSRGQGGDVAELAGQAYLASILIRGKYHEYLARSNEFQLLAHPFRDSIAARIRSTEPIPIPNSERVFVNILIGSALLEPTAKRRVESWTDSIMRAREAIDSNAVSLPPTIQESDAEAHAVTAARRLSLPGCAAWERDLLNWAVGANVGLYLALVLGPWGLVGSLSLAGYKALRKSTIGEDLAIATTTKANFRRLGNAVAGKIARASNG
jgi:hypothetical protein